MVQIGFKTWLQKFTKQWYILKMIKVQANIWKEFLVVGRKEM